jgi:hypothetical protein
MVERVLMASGLIQLALILADEGLTVQGTVA